VAETPEIELGFDGGCPDCGQRTIRLPYPLPEIGDDFDWTARDFDGFRHFLLEELAAAFPERSRWTVADFEVVLAEAFATVLDQLSDMLDRVSAEAFLETARQPRSVRRLLQFIGYDAVRELGFVDDASGSAVDKFDADALAVEKARLQGPRSVFTQRRMVTVEDYAIRLEEHPLVLRANAWSRWSGSWTTLNVALIGWENTELDGYREGQLVTAYPEELKQLIKDYHRLHTLYLPDLDPSPPPTLRAVLRPCLDTFRMAGQEVVLRDAVFVGLVLSLSIQVAPNYYQSEIAHAVEYALGREPGGFFEPGRLMFGEDIYVSDIVQQLMQIDGIEHVCLNRFKRVGSQYPDRVEEDFIPLNGLEIAICDNLAGQPERGYYRLKLSGGRKG
jgi:hypothetical protein